MTSEQSRKILGLYDWKLWCAVAGAFFIVLTIVLIAYHFTSIQYKAELQRMSRALSVASHSLWRYGTIESVHPEDRTIIIAIATRFGTGRVDRKFRLHVPEGATIAQQRLTEENGVYVGISPLTPISFDALKSGMVAAVVIKGDDEGKRLTAETLIVGSPL